ncbi:MAG: energy transducer TonB [Gammaproteobacteria bacterium]|nr:energy transducer TonB [Pseudomonadales bacterium]MCP5329518.1 energy transducer TonB [Pseudomonadales bacterium]
MSVLSIRKIALSASALAVAVASASVSADEIAGRYMSSTQLTVRESVTPAYPLFADMAGVDGYVLVEFTVAADGSVTTPAIADASSGQFTQSALNAISRWQFEPVMDNGVAVPVRSNLKFSFVPRSE